ncbi:MAG: ABC transporter permease [Candidatus Altiarchaeota archaeon]|nr:ABC transporter permease [Candidatus Altiarchaeota archaeon]
MLSVANLVIKFVSHRKLRSFLTTIGIAVGVALVFGLISVNRGFVVAISGTLEGLGDNFVTVMPKTASMGLSSSSPFTQRDVDTLDKLIFVQSALGGYGTNLPAEIRGDTVFVTIRGVESDKLDVMFKEVQPYGFIMGRPLTSGERGKIVVGYKLADDYSLSPGSQIEIADKDFRVVGIMEQIGSNQIDNLITANVEDIWELVDAEGEYLLMFAKVTELKIDEIERALKRVRGKEDFEVSTPENLVNQISDILQVINLVFLSVASISILVGSVGVANTMYMAVAERTRDIGILKAIGAGERHIITIFMLESGLLSVVGGLVGILLGLGINYVFGYIVTVTGIIGGYEFSFNWDLMLATIALSFAIGVISGFFPARYASKMEPVQALKGGAK